MRRFVRCAVLFVLVCTGVGFADNSTILPPELGAHFRLPAQEEFWPGDIFYLYGVLTNPTQETLKDIPVFVLWTCGNNWGTPYYWPMPETEPWRAGDVHYYTVDVPPGTTELEIMPPFIVPDSPTGDEGYPFRFLTGMTDPLMKALLGSSEERAVVIHF